MSRPRKPASLKKGKSETKAQKKHREEIERALMGSSNRVKNIPEYLTNDEKIYYKWLVEEIEISGLLTNLDVPLIEQTANCLHVMRLCDDDIRKNGLLIHTIDRYENESYKANPSIKIKLDYMTKYTTLCNQLGLSPAARASLAGKQLEAKQENEDPILQLLKGNG